MKTYTSLSLLLIGCVLLPTASYAGRYDGIIKHLDEFMGGAAIIKRSDSRGFAAVGSNGNRFRMDYDGHGYPPHFHLEVPKPSGGHMDAPGSQHHNYFKE